MVEVRPLTPELHDEWLAFFDRDAFADNPAWDGCYCVYDHARGSAEDFNTDEGLVHREWAVAGLRSGRIRGHVAYREDRLVGWVHATRRPDLPHLKVAGIDTTDGGQHVGIVTCFVVAHDARRQGVMRALLEAALDGFRNDGLRVAEAYAAADPSKDPAAYRGPLSFYLANGFEQVTVLPDGHVHVRRRL